MDDAPLVCDDVARLLESQGEFPRFLIQRHPEWVEEFVEIGMRPLDVAELEERLAEDLARTPTVAEFERALRLFKRRECLRVFWREVEGTASIRETTAEIADIAQVCLDAALRRAASELSNPGLANHICVLGMGKLGGHELNFSSDIDLIFVCTDDVRDRLDEVDQVARVCTSMMSQITEDGYVFRVDLRLRPHGTQGPLVPPASSAIEYYASWGRTWERGALLKARPVAGNIALGDELLQRLDGFIFRKYLDFQAIEELRGMKEKINLQARASDIVGAEEEATAKTDTPDTPLKQRLHHKLAGVRSGRRPIVRQPEPQPATKSGLLGWDVKIGLGGIREIEFFVQALQLVHCGTRPNLRVKNTLDALDRLLFSGLITHDDHDVLAEAYAFLRRVEHRIQMGSDRQGHRLPEDRELLRDLARRMGFEVDEFRARVLEHRSGVHAMFARLFESDEVRSETQPTLQPEEPDALDTILGASPESFARDGVLNPEASILKALESLGFERPKQVAGQVLILREKNYGPFADRALRGESNLAAYLLETAGATPQADQAFSHLTRFITSIGDRPGYFKMLADNPHACRLLIHVFGSSPYLSGALLKEPAIVERLLGAGSVAMVRSASDMQSDLESRLSRVVDPEHRIGVIRRFHQEETLRIGLHDAGGAIGISQTLEQLSLLAESVISSVLREVYEPMRTYRRREGSVLPPLDEIPFVVVAMGKLGGRELGFGSDLDLLFLYQTDRQWKLEHTFFSKLTQRIIRTLSSAGADGKMYDVDTRLRPSGQQGALIVSLEAFESYHDTKAAFWERQALVRARPLVGAPYLLEAFNTLREELVFKRPLKDTGGQEIWEMVTRLQEHHRASSFDIKLSPGALVEIEFAVQWLQLKFGADEPSLRTPSTVEALRALEELEILDLDFRQLRKDYQKFRVVETRLRMSGNRGVSTLPSDPAHARILAKHLGYDGDEATENMFQDLQDTARRARQITEEIFRLSRA